MQDGLARAIALREPGIFSTHGLQPKLASCAVTNQVVTGDGPVLGLRAQDMRVLASCTANCMWHGRTFNGNMQAGETFLASSSDSNA